MWYQFPDDSVFRENFHHLPRPKIFNFNTLQFQFGTFKPGLVVAENKNQTT